MIRVNIEAVTALCSTFVPPMVDQAVAPYSTSPHGRIPTTLAALPTRRRKAYALSFTQALHAELRDRGHRHSKKPRAGCQTGLMDAPRMDEAAVLPKPMVAPGEAAEAGVRGLRAVTESVPGLANVASTLIGQHTPRWLLLSTLRRIAASVRPQDQLTAAADTATSANRVADESLFTWWSCRESNPVQRHSSGFSVRSPLCSTLGRSHAN